MLRSRARASQCRVELRRSLGGWAASWDDLVLQASLPTPFLRSWWLEGVATRRTRYLLVVDGDALVGGLALEARRFGGVSVYRLAGTGRLCPDHLDLVAATDRRAEVVDAVRAWFTGRGARLLDADGLVDGSLLSAAFPNATPRRIDVAPYEPLAGADGYERGLSASFRRNVRRKSKQLAERGVSVVQPGDADPDEALAAFAALHGAREDRSGLMTEWPRLRRALAAGASRDEVRFHVARTADSIVAVTVCFAVGGRLALYQNARSLDPRFSGIGTVLDHAAIRDAARAGLREADMLRGDEDYKWHFVTREREIYRLTAAHGIAAHALRIALASLRRGARLRHRGRLRGAAGSAGAGALHAPGT